MGDRGNICMKMEDGGQVFFYSHWGGYALPETLKAALIRARGTKADGGRFINGRWDDEPYLARIIFNEMTKGDEMETSGFGISTYLGDNEREIIYVSVKEQTVTIADKVTKFEDYVK